MQREKGDNLADGYVSELWDFTRISVTQNNLQELVLSPRPVLKSCLQFFHIWEGRLGAYDRRICGLTSMFKVLSR
ncbi:hypothetical protein Golax_022821 [Gossypium laxum]|uniref:Uncharacterized protein n=1 Tax=Gossypium laxum TaxID=34288 RepID=A0A7J9AZJ0_9ROSI|nr:hypothetical protein [Gossypium laxum]